jgi:hypothetical protein
MVRPPTQPLKSPNTKFEVVSTHKRGTAMKSSTFRYVLDKISGTHSLFRCNKRKMGCKSLFWFYPTTNEYACHHTRHTCVDPPRDDITLEEATEVLLVSVLPSYLQPIPKTKILTKVPKRAAG